MRAEAHKNVSLHIDDMYEVFGFQRQPRIDEWMRFISSEMIDQPGGFYEYLKTKYVGFTCKHRALFHWGYSGMPWNSYLEKRVKDVFRNKADSVKSLMLADLRIAQGSRNREIDRKTRELFTLKERDYRRFFAGMAYDIHLLGDYMPDNTDFDGLQDFESVVGDIINRIEDLDKVRSKMIVKGIKQRSRTAKDDKYKAKDIMAYLKQEMPKFIKEAREGYIYRRLKQIGIVFIE